MPKEPDPTVKEPKPEKAQVVCSTCSGRGLVSVGVHDVTCATCAGSGYV